MSTTGDLGPAQTFFRFMDAVMASDLTSSQRLILIAQAKHADADDGKLTNSFPSVETLAEKTGLSERTIKRERPKLEALGWLVLTHSGRGGSSKFSNEYDLRIPDPKGHGGTLQSDMVSRQRDMVSKSKGHGGPTSTPSSSPGSTPQPSYASTVDKKDTGKDGQVSYWVGTSRKHPEGYFIRVDGSTVEPKGDHVLVTLTREENRDLFGCYGYAEIRDILLGYARDAGPRPATQADEDDRFISWLSETLGVPELSINRKFMIARLHEALEAFPGLDWTILQEAPSWQSILDAEHPERAFWSYLPKAVKTIVRLRAA